MYHSDEASISGYLYKKTRDGRWQKRWFETNGVYLTYYKSKKMEKLLAALSLPQVGDIKIISADQDTEQLDGLFSIELNTRVYTLRGKSNDEALQWVSTLNRLRTEGIKAANSPQTPLSQPISNVDNSKSSSKPDDNNQTAEQSDWIKTGKSCFGCC